VDDETAGGGGKLPISLLALAWPQVALGGLAQLAWLEDLSYDSKPRYGEQLRYRMPSFYRGRVVWMTVE
jgi:hypothetical protein